MNGNGSDAAAALEDIDDMTESDELEMDEAVAESEGAEFFPPFLPIPGLPFGGGGRGRRMPVPGNYFAARPQSPFVTQTQLQSALTKVRNDVARNARGITALNTRANGLQAVTTRHGRELVKQTKVNERQTRELRAGLKKLQDNSLMMFLLTRPKTTTPVTAANTALGGAAIPVGNKILIQPEKDNSLLLMLALSGGLGGDSGGGGDSNMLLMVLALSGGL
jgi:hypothetical protein